MAPFIDDFNRHADHLGKRRVSFKLLFKQANLRECKKVVETGCFRLPNNWAGDGGSTWLFGAWCAHKGAHLWTVDIDPEAIERCQQVTAEWQEHITYTVNDSVAFLNGFDQEIDLLYLDSWDFSPRNPAPSQNHSLAEAQAAFPKLAPRALVSIDDCKMAYGGKGGLSVPWLTDHGFRVLHSSYQIILARP